MTAVPFVDLQEQHRALESELSAAVSQVMSRCDFVLGSAVEQFEKEFAEFLGARYAVGVGNGLDALRLALQAAGVEPGDEVIVPANTYIATALAVSALGGCPVPVDVDEKTFNIDPAGIGAALTSRTKALIPVHLFGQPCDMEEVCDIARRHDLVLIEDACQAHGARFRGRCVGTFGLAGCFSFYPSKNLGACGDGGMVVTDDEQFAERLRLLRNYGSKEKYRHIAKGTNTRLDTLQAAILRVKLQRLENWNAARLRHAQRYSGILREIASVRLPEVAPDRTHIFHLYVVRVERRAELQKFLAERQIQTMIHYPVPIHLHRAYEDLGFRRGAFPVAERLADEVLSLPMFAELADEQIDSVCDAIREFYRA